MAVLLGCRVFGQSFDVAAVKPSRPGPNGRLPMRIAFELGGQRFIATDAPLKNLIMTAYGVVDLQVSGALAWLGSEGFDVDAKTERPASQEDMCLMLRNLLADRFGLQLQSHGLA